MGDPDEKRFVDIGITNLPGWQGWQSMQIVYFFVLKIPYSKEDNTAVYFNGHSHFFINHYYKIRQAFKPEEYPKTESALTVLKNERAKTRFGYKEPPQEEKLSFFTRLFKSFSK